MADDKKETLTEDDASAEAADMAESTELAEVEEGAVEAETDGMAPAQLGATKYVQAAFFAGGILLAFITGRVLGTVWNLLAEWPAAVRAVPQLLRYAEDERPTYTMTVGALVALVATFRAYRKESTRRWADEVATELSKVVWPNKETVTNGTVVVIIASAVATLYVGLLDRFWSFVTTLVYGA